MDKWRRAKSRRHGRRGKGDINSSCYQFNSRGSEENPQTEITPSLPSSVLTPSSFPSHLSFPSLWDAVRRIAIITTRFMCCGHCVYRLWMFLVLLCFRVPGDTGRSFETGSGIISSDKWRLKVLRRGLIFFFLFFVSVKLVLPPLIDTVCTVKCRDFI